MTATVIPLADYEAAHVSAAKDIAHAALDGELHHGGPVSPVAAADAVIEALQAAGVAFPTDLRSPFATFKETRPNGHK